MTKRLTQHGHSAALLLLMIPPLLLRVHPAKNHHIVILLSDAPVHNGVEPILKPGETSGHQKGVKQAVERYPNGSTTVVFIK